MRMVSMHSAAFHEAAHAVVDFLVGIRLQWVAIGEVSPNRWVGNCIPRGTEKKYLLDRSVAAFAGMFGSQMAEDELGPIIPRDLAERARWGGSDDVPEASRLLNSMARIQIERCS